MPNENADRRTLARRVSFDITGLPPDENLFKLYLRDKIDYETYVDSLLDNNSFGDLHGQGRHAIEFFT